MMHTETDAGAKLLAEWFWADRWMGSSGFLLPIAARGLYREMLTQAWRRGARLPHDPEAIRRACGVTEKEWRQCWPLVAPHWRVEGGYLVNDTQLVVYADALAKQAATSARGRKAATARWAKQPPTDTSRTALVDARAHAQASPPASAQGMPSVSVSSTTSPPSGSSSPRTRGRITLLRWQEDALIAMLGPHAVGFDLDAWIFALSAHADAQALVLDRRTAWPWIQAELRAECVRRGLPVAQAADVREVPANRWTPSPARAPWVCPHDPHCSNAETCAVVTSRACPHTPPCAGRQACVDRILGGRLMLRRRGQKYHASPTVVHGRRFDSQAEARRYEQLLQLGAAGHLDNLELQPAFRLVVAGLHIATYRADFAYRTCAGGVWVVEDVKGVRTAVYTLKKRLVQALHGVTVQEITRR